MQQFSDKEAVRGFKDKYTLEKSRGYFNFVLLNNRALIYTSEFIDVLPSLMIQERLSNFSKKDDEAEYSAL